MCLATNWQDRPTAALSRRLEPARTLAGVACALAFVAGCATPRGELFPALDPPKVWPAPPETPRIRWLGVIGNSRDLSAAQPGVEVFKAALRGPRPPLRFSSPHGVAVSESRFVAVADGTGGAVHILDIVARTHHKVSGYQSELFESPMGVAWAGRRLFVTDAARHEVVELDLDGAFQQRFGLDELTRPVGVAYVPQRKQLYVVDGGAHKIVQFNLDGSPGVTLGGRGSEPGQFNFPTHISCRGNRLVVADSGNFRVQVLDLNGAPIASMGKKGDAAGDLSLPKGVAFDRDGHVYVVDAQFENVQIFNQAGQLLMALGEPGTDRGRFWLPAGLAIDDQDRIWVADAGNRRLQVFDYLRTTP